MAKSRETFGKKEKEKKKLKQRQEKAEKMEERKSNKGGKALEDMMAYIDEDGNLSSTPPDPRKMRVVNHEDIEIGVPKREEVEESPIRSGVVTFFNNAKGFGFINDLQSQERVFVHVNQLRAPLNEGDKVTFEVENGPKGLNAINVTVTE